MISFLFLSFFIFKKKKKEGDFGNHIPATQLYIYRFAPTAVSLKYYMPNKRTKNKDKSCSILSIVYYCLLIHIQLYLCIDGNEIELVYQHCHQSHPWLQAIYMVHIRNIPGQGGILFLNIKGYLIMNVLVYSPFFRLSSSISETIIGH